MFVYRYLCDITIFARTPKLGHKVSTFSADLAHSTAFTSKLLLHFYCLYCISLMSVLMPRLNNANDN